MRQFIGTVRFSPLMLAVLATLAGVVALAGAFAAFAILAPGGDDQASANVDWKAPLPSVDNLGEPRPASGDVQTITRPIFNKDRKPTPKTAGSAPKPVEISDTPTGLKVSAIIKHGQQSRAFVSGAGGQGDWKAVGDKVDNWTISEIAREELTVSNGETSARLQLYSDKPVPDDPAAAAQRLPDPPPDDAEARSANPEPPTPPAPDSVEAPGTTDAPPRPPTDGAQPDASRRQQLRRAPP